MPLRAKSFYDGVVPIVYDTGGARAHSTERPNSECSRFEDVPMVALEKLAMGLNGAARKVLLSTPCFEGVVTALNAIRVPPKRRP